MNPKKKQERPKLICPTCGGLFGDGDKKCPKDGAALEETTDSLAGKSVGNYVLIRRLGRGGTGTVYLAIQPDIGSSVAIKILSEAASEDRSQLERFLTEAQSVNKIGHPNIIKILDKGEMEDGRPYVLMELLDGSSLKECIYENPGLTMHEKREIVEQILDALQAAHEAGFIHRDLKPENIHITSDKRAKLLDFGLAKLMNRECAGLTQTGAILGTPLYLAPEQASGRQSDIGPQTDIYCMGVVLYELYTKTLPFQSNNVYNVVSDHINKEPPPPGKRNPLISKAMEKVILKCLKKNPSERFQTAAELMEEYISAHEGFVQGLEDTLSGGFPPQPQIQEDQEFLPREGTTGKEILEQIFAETEGRLSRTRPAPVEQKPADKPVHAGSRLSKRHLSFGLALATAAVLAILIFATKSGDESDPPGKPTAAVEPEGRLVILQKRDTESLLPTEVEYTPSINILINVFEPLVLFEPLTGRIKPWLAEQWKPSEDGYVFTLREGVKFHNGQKLNAETAVNSLKRTLKSTHGKTYFWDVKEVRTVAPMQLEIKLAGSSPSFLTRLSLWPAFIHLEHDPFPVGTGPFMFKSRNAQIGAVVLEAFMDHRLGPPRLKELVFRVAVESSAQTSLLIQGDAHIAGDISPAAALELFNMAPINVYKTATNVTAYVFFNTTKPYLASPEVRKALSMAIDTDTLLADLYKYAARPASGSLPPVMAVSGRVKGAGPPPFSPEQAAKALEGKDVLERTLKILLPSEPRSSVPDPEKMGSILVEGLARSGIKAEAVFLSSDKFYESCGRGEHDLAIFGWIPDYPDPENVYFLLSKKGMNAGYNLALYNDDTYEKLMASALIEQDLDERKNIFFQMETHLKENRPWVPLFYVSAFVGIRREVKGAKLGVEQCLGGADLFLQGAYLEESK